MLEQSYAESLLFGKYMRATPLGLIVQEIRHLVFAAVTTVHELRHLVLVQRYAVMGSGQRIVGSNEQHHPVQAEPPEVQIKQRLSAAVGGGVRLSRAGKTALSETAISPSATAAATADVAVCYLSLGCC